jgi:hypothetical protein
MPNKLAGKHYTAGKPATIPSCQTNRQTRTNWLAGTTRFTFIRQNIWGQVYFVDIKALMTRK